MSNWIPIKIADLALDEKEKEIARLKAEVERLTISNALTLERLEASQRLNAIRRLKDKPETGPLTDAPD